MAIRENIVLILDEILEPYLDFSSCCFDDPNAVELEISVFSANSSGKLICTSNLFEFDIPTPNKIENKKHLLFPSLNNYCETIRASSNRHRDLLIIATCSENGDESVQSVFQWLKNQKINLLGIALFNFGNFIDVTKIQKYIDFLVLNEGSTIKESDLSKLWGWLPECLNGFQMYWFEGHHPGGYTYLSTPPDPFRGVDYAQKRLDDFFVNHDTQL